MDFLYYIGIIIFLAIIVTLKIKSAKIKGFLGEIKVNDYLKQIGPDYFPFHNIIIRTSEEVLKYLISKLTCQLIFS